jgi:hypothetical protein
MSSQQPPSVSPKDDASFPQAGQAIPRHPALDRIDDALRGLRYGSVLAIVQDGVVVQIERTEKTRLTQGEQR